MKAHAGREEHGLAKCDGAVIGGWVHRFCRSSRMYFLMPLMNTPFGMDS